MFAHTVCIHVVLSCISDLNQIEQIKSVVSLPFSGGLDKQYVILNKAFR